MSKSKWEYRTEGNYASGAIVNVENDEIVLYRDDTSVDTIVETVALYNSGSSVKDIEAFLKEDTRVTDDEADAVLEQITLYLQLSAPKLSGTITTENSTITAGQASETPNSITVTTVIDDSEKKPDPVNHNPAPTVEKEKKQRTPRTTPVVNGTKKISAEDAIKALQAQQIGRAHV